MIRRPPIGFLGAALLVAAISCGGGTGHPDTGTGTPDASEPARPLAAGAGMGADRLPDCAHYVEQTGKTDSPVEGRNCARWDILANLRGRTRSAHAIVIGRLHESIRGYETGASTSALGKCRVETVEGTQDSFTFYIPIGVDDATWWKGESDESTSFAIEGRCEGDGGFSCRFDNPSGTWNVGPGMNLMFLNRDCCLDQVIPGSMHVSLIYPVEADTLFDWDGTRVPLESVRTGILAAIAEEVPGELPAGDNTCPPPYHMDNDLPDAQVEDAE